MALSFIDQKSTIINQVFRWYSRSARRLPWRGEKDPYRILVSEIMLQQTQVSRVLQQYPRFLKRFPDFTALARARTSSIIRAWKGMGYNNRAVRLQRLARNVLGEYNGKLPTTIEDLLSLPGIGRYTAHAVACLAFNRHLPVVDTNVRRVLSRLFLPHAKRMETWELAEKVLPKRGASRWNQALMDLGATICTAVNPKCRACPVQKKCPSAFKVSNSRRVSKGTEPSRDGLPNRIYRGRIVDVLRHSKPERHVPISRLGRQIKESYSRHDEDWLKGLMKGLEKDGLVALKKTKAGFAASLPR